MIVTRFFHYVATVSLEGTFVFWCFIAWPALRRTKASQAFVARVDRLLFALAWASLLVALASGAAWFVIVASHMSGMPLGAVLQGGSVLGIVLTQTRFGEDWVLRAALVLILAACLAVQGLTRKHAAAWVGLLAAAAFIASLAWAGHGAATENVPFDAIHLPADILHLLAAGAWLGALVPLAVFLAQAHSEGSSEAVTAACAATLRFSKLGIASVGTLLVTGCVNAWFLTGTIPALLGTLYGQLLLVKVALFGVMVAVASVNQLRHLPTFANVDLRLRAVRQVSLNASIEAGLGLFVLGIVGIIGVLPPGLHTEPRWPLPFRIDLGEISIAAQTVLEIATVAFILCLVAAALTAGRKRRREMVASLAGIVIFGSVGLIALRPAIVRAYPTSFYASTQPYAAPSVTRGAPLYAQNCTACHGAGGRGDGPLAGKLPVRPADLTEPHLFAHKVGELYWWVSYGRDNGIMPGFAGKLTPDQRWDLINFLLARAAGALSDDAGPQISTTVAAPLPDFAFERNGAQNTLSQTLKSGPVLLVLFAAPTPRARLEQLASWEARLASAPLQIVAVALDRPTTAVRLSVEVSDDVRAALGLFRSHTDGGETELMLDRGADVRARWTAIGQPGLADDATLFRDAVRVATIPVAAANHAGHAH